MHRQEDEWASVKSKEQYMTINQSIDKLLWQCYHNVAHKIQSELKSGQARKVSPIGSSQKGQSNWWGAI